MPFSVRLQLIVFYNLIAKIQINLTLIKSRFFICKNQLSALVVALAAAVIGAITLAGVFISSLGGNWET